MRTRNQARGSRDALEQIFRAAVAAVEPSCLVAKKLRELEGERIYLIAAGKAAPTMAETAIRILGDRIAGGVVAAPTRMRRKRRGVASFVAGHPLPDSGSLAAGKAVWKLAGRAREGDVVLVLLSGGASSLLVLPASGITLGDKIAVNRSFLRARVPIGELNTVRKHLSRLKGGGLARRAGRARVVGLLLSDVIGSSPSVIGSGPTAADSTTYQDAWRVLDRHVLLDDIPPRVGRHLQRGRRGLVPETPKPRARHVSNAVIGDNRLALVAAAARALSLGFEPRILTASMRGDTRRAARRFAAAVLRARRTRRDLCLLAGGETTVEVRGDGLGGRNQEFALVLAEAICGVANVHCLSAGTDGRDGPTNAAGAFADGSTIDRAEGRGLESRVYLERNDSYRFFSCLGDLFRPGPTGTNVMDLKIAILRGRGRD